MIPHKDNGALEEADWQCCREPTLNFFLNCLGKCWSGIMLPWGNSTRQARLPPAPTPRNVQAKLQQQVEHVSPFICKISRSGISKDQVLISLPHKKRATVCVRNNSNYCQWNFLLERACSPQPWALGMTYGQQWNISTGGKIEKPTMNFGIYYCARHTNMGSKLFLTKRWETCFIVCAVSSWKTFRDFKLH